MSGSEKRPDWLDKTDEEWMREWEQEKGTHWFSEKYEREKRENLAWVRRRGGKGMRKKRVGKWIGAAVALILVPGTVFAAGKLYEAYVEQQGYQADLHVVRETEAAESTEEGASEENAGVNYYYLKLNYVPAGMKYMEIHGKYLWDDPDHMVGISGCGSYRLDGEDNVLTVLDVEEQEVAELGGRTVCLFWSASGKRNEAYVVFEEEGILAHLSADISVSDDELRKVLENLELQPITEEELPEPARRSGFYLSDELSISQLKEMESNTETLEAEKEAVDDEYEIMETGRVLGIGEAVSIYQAYGEAYPPEGYAEVRITVENVEILDNVSQLLRDNFERPADGTWWNERFADDGRVLPYVRQEIEYGNGIDAPYETVVNEEEVGRKLVLVTIKRENLSDKDLPMGVTLLWIGCFTSDVREENGAYSLRQNRMWLQQSRSFEIGGCIYVSRDNSKDIDSDGKGRQFASWQMNANDVQEYTLGFLIDEDRLTDLYYTERGSLEPDGEVTTIAFRIN